MERLPEEDRARAVAILRKELDRDTLVQVRAAMALYGRHEWVHELHFHMFGGMSIRNVLRRGGFPDKDLPDLSDIYGVPPSQEGVRNWDDFYIPVLEQAARSLDDISPSELAAAREQIRAGKEFTDRAIAGLRRMHQSSAERPPNVRTPEGTFPAPPMKDPRFPRVREMFRAIGHHFHGRRQP
jgi:hypothetical protein